ncbi:MAG TPA: hypothetical protein VGL86_13385 [Polyangia bacterium]|jgi:hypothetical protein
MKRMLAVLVILVAMIFGGAAARADECAPASCNAYGCYQRGGGCNAYGCWSNGGGCNVYGCWNTPDGSCNAFGCSSAGVCSAYGCP